MVRPPAMIPYLQKAQAGEPYDKGEFEACLTESVIEAVRLQAEAGIDVVSDGEYGKSGLRFLRAGRAFLSRQPHRHCLYRRRSVRDLQSFLIRINLFQVSRPENWSRHFAFWEQ
jgi:hypothetical protein